jgi:ferric-dicitrate binding protein FerR (iron transport regulator)
MSQINKKEFHSIVKKYLDGNATPQETELVEQYYMSFNDQPEILDQLSDHEVNFLDNRINRGISKKINAHQKRVIPIYQNVYVRAAVLFIGILTATIFYISYNKTAVLPVQKLFAEAPAKTLENKFTTLADGSKILLHKGSKLTWTNSFNKSTREVYLSGEAYFDIQHDAARPFIIHTGKVKTTVLGTAFNIKAYPGQENIIVSVTRGRVKVEDDKKILAILTPEEQVVYHNQSSVSEPQKLIAPDALSWAKFDLSFEATPYKVLAEKIEQHYGITLRFTNPRLELCQLTGKFSGILTLEQVMDILAIASNTKYVIDEDIVTIDGKGCN